MSDPILAADPSLASMYRMIAMVKGAVALGFVAILIWRLRSAPISRTRTCAYCTVVGSMLLAIALLAANRTFGLVPFLFEGALFTVPLLALSDRQAWTHASPNDSATT